MNPTERGLTADDIYEMTVADDIENGQIGNLTVGQCPECSAPQETTQPLCSKGNEVTCSKHLDPYCIDGFPVCQSQCLNTLKPYCDSANGICTQESSGQAPQCNCLKSQDTFYFGTRCQLSLNKIGLYVGVAAFVFFVIFLLVVLSVCLLVSKKQNSKDGRKDHDSNSVEEVLGIQSYGYTNEVYDPTNPDTEVYQSQQKSDFDIFDPVKSYTGYKGPDSADRFAISRINRQKDPAFWGNLSEDLNQDETELQPISYLSTHT